MSLLWISLVAAMSTLQNPHQRFIQLLFVWYNNTTTTKKITHTHTRVPRIKVSVGDKEARKKSVIWLIIFHAKAISLAHLNYDITEQKNVRVYAPQETIVHFNNNCNSVIGSTASGVIEYGKRRLEERLLKIVMKEIRNVQISFLEATRFFYAYRIIYVGANCLGILLIFDDLFLLALSIDVSANYVLISIAIVQQIVLLVCGVICCHVLQTISSLPDNRWHYALFWIICWFTVILDINNKFIYTFKSIIKRTFDTIINKFIIRLLIMKIFMVIPIVSFNWHLHQLVLRLRRPQRLRGRLRRGVLHRLHLPPRILPLPSLRPVCITRRPLRRPPRLSRRRRRTELPITGWATGPLSTRHLPMSRWQVSARVRVLQCDHLVQWWQWWARPSVQGEGEEADTERVLSVAVWEWAVQVECNSVFGAGWVWRWHGWESLFCLQ